MRSTDALAGLRTQPVPPDVADGATGVSPSISSILVYCGQDLVGDGLIKLPFMRALRHAWPDAHITWMAGIGKSAFAGPLAELAAPLLDEVVEEAGIGRGWHELVRRPLPARSFDLIVDTQRRFRTTLILRRIRHRVFVSCAARTWLSSRRPSGFYRKEPHMLAAMLRLVELASGHAPQVDLRLPLPARYVQAAEEALPGGPYLGFAPGAGGIHKRWPLDRFVAVARAMEDRGYRPVFLLGPDEREWAGSIRAECPAALIPLQDAPLDPALRRSPLFTIACAGRLDAAVANDCGTGHMLAAADVRLLSLFGPTDPAKFAPVVTRAAVLRAQDFGGRTMVAIPAEAVAAALAGLLH